MQTQHDELVRVKMAETAKKKNKTRVIKPQSLIKDKQPLYEGTPFSTCVMSHK